MRSLTKEEMNKVVEMELANIHSFGVMTDEEVRQFEAIIREEMTHWTLDEYHLYMSRNDRLPN